MPVHIVRFQCKWLEKETYKMKVQGKTTDTYTSKVDHFLFGTGQGTGWSPPIWNSMSDLISRVLDKHSTGMKLTHPNRTSVERVIDTFLDDVNGGLTLDGLRDFKPGVQNLIPKLSSIRTQTHANVKIYSQHLFTTWGCLALHK